MLSERAKIAIKFWGGVPPRKIAKQLNRSESWVSTQTDIIMATRPRYDNRG
jgi:IS30 family transposase